MLQISSRLRNKSSKYKLLFFSDLYLNISKNNNMTEFFGVVFYIQNEFPFGTPVTNNIVPKYFFSSKYIGNKA